MYVMSPYEGKSTTNKLISIQLLPVPDNKT